MHFGQPPIDKLVILAALGQRVKVVESVVGPYSGVGWARAAHPQKGTTGCPAPGSVSEVFPVRLDRSRLLSSADCGIRVPGKVAITGGMREKNSAHGF